MRALPWAPRLSVALALVALTALVAAPEPHYPVAVAAEEVPAEAFPVAEDELPVE